MRVSIETDKEDGIQLPYDILKDYPTVQRFVEALFATAAVLWPAESAAYLAEIEADEDEKLGAAVHEALQAGDEARPAKQRSSREPAEGAMAASDPTENRVKGSKRDEVLRLSKEGLFPLQIAGRMGISRDSVDAHRSQLRKVGLLP